MAPGDDDRLPTDWRPHPSPAPNPTAINLLMMRFRPIAPKPPNNGDPTRRLLGSSCSTSTSTSTSTSDAIHRPGKAKSTKGKCLRVRSSRGRCSPIDAEGHTSEGTSDPLRHHEMEISESDTDRTTFHLMMTDPRADESSASVKAGEGDQPNPFWQPTGSSSHSGFSVEFEDEGTRLSHPTLRPVIPNSPLPDLNDSAFPSLSLDPVACKRVLDVCLIVESVAKDSSSIQVVEQLLGHTDEERLAGLAVEDCPGFVSDVDKRVRWVNGAFERMMTAELAGWGGRGEVEVRMVASAEAEEDWSTYSTWEAFFTSRVRIQYTWREESCPVWWGPRVVTVAPCDAWRLCSGGFAWRVDVNSALSLGR